MPRHLTALLVVVFMALCPCPSRAGEPFHIVYYESFRPYSWTENGETKGLLIDILTEAFENRLGVRVVNQGLPWERAQRMVEYGKADAFTTVPTPWRLSFSRQSEESVVPVTFSIYGWHGNPRNEELEKITSISELEGFRLGAYTGSGWSKKNLKGMDVHWVPSMENVLQMLAARRIDAFVDVTLSVRRYIERLGLEGRIRELPRPIDAMSFKLFIGNNSAHAGLMPRFDAAIRQMKEDGGWQRILGEYGMSLPAEGD